MISLGMIYLKENTAREKFAGYRAISQDYTADNGRDIRFGVRPR